MTAVMCGLVGYLSDLTVAPGGSLDVMVHCAASELSASVVRLRHGHLDPAGPGFRATPVEQIPARTCRGRVQEIRAGSYAVADATLDLPAGDLTLLAWAWPTTPQLPRQGVLTLCTADGQRGAGAFLERGRLVVRGDGPDGRQVAAAAGPLEARRWQLVALRVRAAAGAVDVTALPLADGVGRTDGPSAAPTALRASCAHVPRAGAVDEAGSDVADDVALALAGTGAHGTPRGWGGAGLFNGKLAEPALYDRALTDAELERLAAGADPAELPGLRARWSFVADTDADRARETTGGGPGLRLVNAPTLAVTSHRWRGDEPCFRHRPREYDAAHFHDDDLDDARWEPTFTLDVPRDLRSGVYAVHLRAGEHEDWVPFAVRPPAGAATARVLLVLPTFSYLAYANEHPLVEPARLERLGRSFEQVMADATPYERALHRRMADDRLLSLYERHSDGSGVTLSSRLRPLLTMRPRLAESTMGFRGTHQLNADLHLVDWLEQHGIAYDVATDEDVHGEGVELLRRYAVVMSGTHPEYPTGALLDACQAYLRAGGRFMYMGGNGFYWVTSVSPSRPHLVEVRRGESGTRTWQVAPGERWHATTGELGGLWRHRGRPPHGWLGVGFAAMCVDESAEARGRPFRRLPASRTPPCDALFDGIGADELIGDGGTTFGAAAGMEVDRCDPEQGSPPETVVLATADAFDATYQRAADEVLSVDGRHGGDVDPGVRADLTLLPYPGGGAVFSVSSMTWASSLAHDGYDNAASRVTANVLRAFLEEPPAT